jgi:hypothetical protein
MSPAFCRHFVGMTSRFSRYIIGIFSAFRRFIGIYSVFRYLGVSSVYFRHVVGISPEVKSHTHHSLELYIGTCQALAWNPAYGERQLVDAR